MLLGLWTLILVGIRTPLVYTDPVTFRVYDGDIADPKKYTYVVALVYTSKKDSWKSDLFRGCTGTAIHYRWVLTAAHCVKDNLVHVQYGNMVLKPNETKWMLPILKAVINPMYTKKTKNFLGRNDLAMLRVEAFHLKTYGKFYMANYKTLNGPELTYVGYGQASYGDKREKYSNQPLLLARGVMKPCIGNIFSGKFIEHYICVVSTRHKNQHSLTGDSGGPLFYNDNIVGVLTGGRRSRKRERNDTIFVPTKYHLPWVYRIISTIF